MEKLGIDLTLLLAQIANFLIILIILTKFLYKPVLAMIKRRQKQIAQGLERAEQMEQEYEKLKKKEQEIFKKARGQAQEIIAQARIDGKKVKDEILAEGKDEVSVIKKRAQEEIAAQKEKAKRQLTEHTVTLAEGMVQKLAGDIFTDQQHRKLINKQLRQIEKAYEKSH